MIGKRLTSVLVALLLLIFIQGAAWGAGFAVNGIGTKAASLGGAFRGLADDWSACFWNPAGLGLLETSQLNASLSATLFRPEYTPNVLYGDQYEVGFHNGVTHYPEDRPYFLPNFSVFYKLPQNGVVIGMASYATYELESHYWNIFDPLPGYNNLAGYPEDDYGPNILIVDFHPTVAKKFSEKLALGLGISVNWADFGLTKANLMPFHLMPPADTSNLLLKNIPVDSKLHMDGWGVGFNLGMLYKISPKVQMGLSFSSPVDIEVEGEMEYTAYFPNHDEVDPEFTGGTSTSIPSAKTTLNLPASAGVGIAYLHSDKLTFTFDASWTGWSRWEELDIDLTGNNPFGGLAQDLNLSYQWDDVFKIALGCQYMYKDNLAFRGGYFYESCPIPNSTLDITVPDIGAKHGFNFGFGREFENGIELGFSQQFVLSSTKTIDKIEDPNDDGTNDNLPGEYKNSCSVSHFSITYRF